MKLFQFFYWILVDYVRWFRGGRVRKAPFGVWCYVGLPGKGKTVSVAEYLDRMRKRHPKIKIYTNFGWVGEDGVISGWRDLIEFSNGEDGVIFGFDEIQNTFGQKGWKDFPPDLLEQLSYSRKDRKQIVGSTQDFDLIDISFRRYCQYVIKCNTLLGRWTFNRAFSRLEYEAFLQNYANGKKAITSWRHSFVQTDALRSQFDTYERAQKLNQLALTGELATADEVRSRIESGGSSSVVVVQSKTGRKR